MAGSDPLRRHSTFFISTRHIDHSSWTQKGDCFVDPGRRYIATSTFLKYLIDSVSSWPQSLRRNLWKHQLAPRPAAVLISWRRDLVADWSVSGPWRICEPLFSPPCALSPPASDATSSYPAKRGNQVSEIASLLRHGTGGREFDAQPRRAICCRTAAKIRFGGK